MSARHRTLFKVHMSLSYITVMGYNTTSWTTIRGKQTQWCSSLITYHQPHIYFSLIMSRG